MPRCVYRQQREKDDGAACRNRTRVRWLQISSSAIERKRHEKSTGHFLHSALKDWSSAEEQESPFQPFGDISAKEFSDIANVQRDTQNRHRDDDGNYNAKENPEPLFHSVKIAVKFIHRFHLPPPTPLECGGHWRKPRPA